METDETLVRDFQQGDNGALESLFRSYQEPLWRYARRLSWYRDKSFIDDIRQQVFETILEGIKKGEFDPRKGSFQGWAYGICKNICREENRNYRRQPRALSERYPEEMPDELIQVGPEAGEYHESSDQLEKLLPRLSPEDRQLMFLVGEHKDYNEIQQTPLFNKYSLTTLRQKVCRIRQWLIRLMKEERNAREKK